MKKKVLIYDTTLRDGTQAEGVNFSANDKVLIARKLAILGVHFIEGGWPGSNPKDMAFFTEIKTQKLRSAKVSAFGSTHHARYRAETDPNLAQLIAAQTPVVTVFGKSWILHVEKALQISGERNLSLIEQTCRFLKKHKKTVVYDAEHFFDGFKDNDTYAIDTCRAALKGGADWIVPCDTNGGCLSSEVADIMDTLRRELGGDVNTGIHCHNDGGLAVANSLIAVEHGATMVQGTINGLGERCGNADLCAIIPGLQIKMGIQVLSAAQLKQLTEVSRYISELGNIPHNEQLPYVGNSAFAHKGGIHVSAVQKDTRTYEHIEPERVGNHRRVLVSELAGKSNILYKMKEMGIRLPVNAAEISKDVTQKIKQLESQGFQFEGAEGSLELLLKKAMGRYQPHFALNHYRCTIEKRGDATLSEAAVKLTVKNQEEYVVAEGNGPVNALDAALRKALIKFYPSIARVRLIDYKVRVIASDDGTEARVRVLIESQCEKHIWGTVGVSENIIDASWAALTDSLEYFLLKKK